MVKLDHLGLEMSQLAPISACLILIVGEIISRVNLVSNGKISILLEMSQLVQHA